MADRAKLDEALRRELAVRASCDPRTIEKVLHGEPVRGMAGRRAREALVAAGFDVPPLVLSVDKAYGCPSCVKPKPEVLP